MNRTARIADDVTTQANLSRRTVLRLGGGTLMTAMLLGGHQSAIAQDGTSRPPAAPVPFEGEAFVGVTDRPDLFVALVVGSAEARGYLCDGNSLVTWFAGPAGVDTLSLASDAGDRLEAARQGEGFAGSATMVAGTAVTFSAAPATGIAGLYEVVIGGNRFSGAAAGGLRLDGVVAGSLADGTLLLAGAVALPAGGVRPLAIFASPDSTGVHRWIVLDDGRLTGGPKKGSGAGVMDPGMDFVVPKGEPIMNPDMDF